MSVVTLKIFHIFMSKTKYKEQLRGRHNSIL